jgi:hypothetical protein
MKIDKVPLEYLVETLAKALCFEKYVAINNIKDHNILDTQAASEYFEEHSDLYMHKSVELLSMFHDFAGTENYSNTLH